MSASTATRTRTASTAAPTTAATATTPTIIAVGFDTARFGHHVTFLNEKLEQVVKPFTFQECQAGYAEFRRAWDRMTARHGVVQWRMHLDAAGQYSANLQQYLRTLPGDVSISVGEPKRNKDYRNAISPKRKADPVESYACARFAMLERPQPTPVVPAAFRELREVLSAMQSQTRQTTRLLNQLHNRLSRAFPELALEVKKLSARGVLNLLEKYPTAERLAAAQSKSLKSVPHLKPAVAERLHAAAKVSTASLSGSRIEQIVRNLVEDVSRSLHREQDLEKLLAETYGLLPPGPHKQVLSIKGIGELTAAALVASIVSIDRFATPESLVNYYGVFAEENSSGVDKRGRPLSSRKMRMCQKGNDLIRKLLYMSCLSACQTNPAIRSLHARKMAEGKRGDVSFGHCMRKMLHLVFAVWKTNKPFDPQHYPWEPAAPQPEVANPTEDSALAAKAENVAGRSGQCPQRSAVTATEVNLSLAAVADKRDSPALPSSTPEMPSIPSSETSDRNGRSAAAHRLDFASLRQQVSMEAALRRLGHFESLRGRRQCRGPCPIHKASGAASRSFSVNLDKNIFQCFAAECGARGDVLDLWAAIHQLPLPAAAAHLARTFGLHP